MGNDITTGRILGALPTKYSIISALLVHALHALVIGCISIFLGFYIYYDLLGNTYNTLFVLSCLVIFVEVLRKIIKALLLTMRSFDHVAHIEIASILLYMVLVWSLYGLGYILTPCMLIALLCVISGSTSIFF
jgi:hypothetical protein